MGSMFIAPSNAAFFTNAFQGDMLMRTRNATDNILIGSVSNVHAAVTITSNTISFFSDRITCTNASGGAALCAGDLLVLASSSSSHPPEIESAISASTLHAQVLDAADQDDVAGVVGQGPAPSPKEGGGGWVIPAVVAPASWYFFVNRTPSNAAYKVRRMRTFYVTFMVPQGAAALPHVSIVTHPPLSANGEGCS